MKRIGAPLPFGSDVDIAPSSLISLSGLTSPGYTYPNINISVMDDLIAEQNKVTIDEAISQTFPQNKKN